MSTAWSASSAPRRSRDPRASTTKPCSVAPSSTAARISPRSRRRPSSGARAPLLVLHQRDIVSAIVSGHENRQELRGHPGLQCSREICEAISSRTRDDGLRVGRVGGVDQTGREPELLSTPSPPRGSADAEGARRRRTAGASRRAPTRTRVTARPSSPRKPSRFYSARPATTRIRAGADALPRRRRRRRRRATRRAAARPRADDAIDAAGAPSRRRRGRGEGLIEGSRPLRRALRPKTSV